MPSAKQSEIEAIRAVFTKNLVTKELPENFLRDNAYEILSANYNYLDCFSLTSDHAAIEEIHKKISSAKRLVDGLSGSSRFQLGLAYRGAMKYEEPQIKNAEEMRNLVSLKLNEVVDIIATVKRWKSSDKPSSKNRNWRAAAVARVCRGIWCDAMWLKMHSDIPIPCDATNLPTIESRNQAEARFEEYCAFIEEKLPRSQHHHRPGPFGRFLEEVFVVLEIFSKDGFPVSAATALDSLKKIEHQE